MSTLEELIQKQFDLYVSGVWMDIYSDIKENTEIGGGMSVKFFKEIKEDFKVKLESFDEEEKEEQEEEFDE